MSVRLKKKWWLALLLVPTVLLAQQGTVIIRDRNSNTQADVTPANELSVSVGAIAVTADVNLTEVGGNTTTAGAGAVAAGTLRTTLASDDPAVTSLAILDDWDETNRAAVNIIAGQVGIAGGTGVDGATVPRVTLATDVGLPAGSNNIGDVDVLSFPDNEPFNLNQFGGVGVTAGAALADSTALPTTGMVGAPALVYNSVAGDLDLARSAEAVEFGGSAVGLMAGAQMVRDGDAGDYNAAREARASGGGIGSLGNPAMTPHLWASSNNFNPIQTASSLGDANGGGGGSLDNNAAFNGATYDRQRTADLTTFNTAATLTSANSIGAILTEKGSRWSIVDTGSQSAQASVTIAAEADVRHVADCLSFSAGVDSATPPTQTPLTVSVRDGASGAGTVLWQYFTLIVNTAGIQSVEPHSLCGLNLTGTTNTAMTIEFSASVAQLTQSVSLSGFNVN